MLTYCFFFKFVYEETWQPRVVLKVQPKNVGQKSRASNKMCIIKL